MDEIKKITLSFSPTIVAVTKKQTVEKIYQAIDCGIKHFGENYLQEALPKIEKFKNANICWHFIGQIQENKLKKIAENFSWVQSVGSIEVAEKLNNFRETHSTRLNVLMQLNIGLKPNQKGFTCETIFKAASKIQLFPNLRLRGIMVLPPKFQNEKVHETNFLTANKIFQHLKHCYPDDIDTLSMGMSDDFILALQNGSTMVRIGSKIFGPRI